MQIAARNARGGKTRDAKRKPDLRIDRHGIDARGHGAVRRRGENRLPRGLRSATAVVPQVDHRIGEGLEGVVQLTEAIKAKQ